MELPILHKLFDEGSAVQRRLYAHHDYFSYIIPSTWFFTGVAFLGLIFYLPDIESGVQACKTVMSRFGEPTTAIDLLVGIVLLVLAFNATFIFGHILNGFAAGFLERVVVRKLLSYPFQLYEMKWNDRGSDRNDGERFRDTVLANPYNVHCVNLFPVLIGELAIFAFARVNGHAGTWVDQHKLLTFALAVLGSMIHFGCPYWVKGSRYAKQYPAGARVFKRLFFIHVAFLAIVAGTVGCFIAFQGAAGVLFTLPLGNLLLATVDHRLRRAGRGKHKRAVFRYLYFYLNLTFLNFAYFGAKMVGYGAAPSRDLIGRAKDLVGYTSESNDFFWMAELRIQQKSPEFHGTAYHARALQSMNRNLSNATAFVLLASAVAFTIRWPGGVRHGALIWIAVLAVLTYLFFVRYLFLFAGRHSRFLIRASALLAEEERPQVIATDQAELQTGA